MNDGENAEKKRILQMIQDRTITPEEAVELLSLLEQDPKTGKQSPPVPETTNPPGKWMRIRITDQQTGRLKVNVRMPVSILRAGMKLGARFTPELDGVDMEEFANAIHSGQPGQYIDVYDDEDNEHVEIFIE